MKPQLSGILILTALVGFCSTYSLAADPPGWKQTATIKTPTPPTLIIVSDNHRYVITENEEKTGPFNMGGTASRYVTNRMVRCFNADTGKEILNTNKDGQTERLRDIRVQGNTMIMHDDADFIHIFDLESGKETGSVDTTSINDGPPNARRKISGDTRVGGFQLTTDGKVLVTVRQEGEWKKDAKALGGYLPMPFEQVVFWDVEKKTKIANVDCEDKDSWHGQLVRLNNSNAMIVYFDNGVRILDLEKRQWGLIFPVKDVYAVTPSADEKRLIVTDHMQNVKVFDMETGKELSSFKEVPILKKSQLDHHYKPITGSYEAGPLGAFTSDEKVLRVTLNDGKTIYYRDAATGKDAKKPDEPAPTNPSPGNVLAYSRDREQAVVGLPRTNVLTVFRSTKLESEKAKEQEKDPK
jgi:WD40 repeat protein